MSIAFQMSAKFEPFLPDPVAPLKPRACIGRWLGAADGVGDASGGIASYYISLGAIQGLFPSNVLGDLVSVSVVCVHGPIGGTKQIGLRTGDFLPGSNAPWYWSRYVTYAGARWTMDEMKETELIKLKFPLYRTWPTVLEWNIDNTNGFQTIFTAGGYIYDERYL